MYLLLYEFVWSLLNFLTCPIGYADRVRIPRFAKALAEAQSYSGCEAKGS
jgi:hypothetical protein